MQWKSLCFTLGQEGKVPAKDVIAAQGKLCLMSEYYKKKKKGEKKRKKHLKFSDLVGNYFMAFKSSDVNVCNRNDGVFVCVSPLLTVNS